MRHLVLGLVMALLLSASAGGTSGSGSSAFVTDFANNRLLQLNTATGAVVSIPVGSRPFGVAVLPDGSRVYVTDSSFSNGGVSVVTVAAQTSTFIATGRMPLGVAAAPDGKRVFVTNWLSASMSVINTATDTVWRTLTVGSLPRGVVANPVGPYVYVANQGTGDVAFVNTTNDSFSVVRMAAGSAPYGVAIDPHGQFLYVTLQNDGKLLIMDATSGAIPLGGSVSVGSGPAGVAVSPDGKRVYVANTNSGTVSIVDANAVGPTWTFVKDVTVGAMPVGVSVSSDGSRVYVANSNGATLSVINTATNSVTQTITLPAGPDGTPSSPIAFGSSLIAGQSVITVAIDIKPGGDPNAINLRSRGTVPVAVLSSQGSSTFADFDATQVNPETVTLAGVSVKKKPNGTLMAALEDVNGDGLLDLVVHFDTEELAKKLTASDTQAVLDGQMLDGSAFTGTDSVKIIP